MGKKVVIVGGVAGGATAAARLRRIDEEAEIVVFEKGEYISFANCGLPYYIGDVITQKESLVVQTPQKMKERFNLDVRIRTEVVRIYKDEKMIEVRNLVDGSVYKESYDKLILSPGAEPMRPNMPGIDGERIFTLRNIPDTYKIKDFVEANQSRRAVIVGAGFIGLELAENLHAKNVAVDIVELSDHVIGPLDYDMAAIVHEELKSKDVGLYLKDGVGSFINRPDGVTVVLNSGTMLDADLVILAIGVRPEARLAMEAGLKIGQTGGIYVDEYLMTSDENIYAVGDAIEVMDVTSTSKALIPLAGPANRQGRIVANNISGDKEKYQGTLGTAILKVFDLTVATVGNNERILKRNNIEFEKSFTRSGSHAGYYPGSKPITIKLLFGKKDGIILGASAIGEDGVDKRIDVLATAMSAKMTVFDLYNLELAYAPPFSSAKDPVNIAGYAASNIIKGDTKIFHWHDVESIDLSNDVLLDVRETEENLIGHIQGSMNIPLGQLRERYYEISKDKNIYVYCQVGLRGYIAQKILKQNGFNNVLNLSGGYGLYAMIHKDQNNHIDRTDRKEDKTSEVNIEDTTVKKTITVDACGIQCPGPIIKVYESLKEMNLGESLTIIATDPAFKMDIEAWCLKTENTLVSVQKKDKTTTAVIMKGKETQMQKVIDVIPNGKTIVVFSNDLDKSIASFIIANGAAAMGRKVTMFFTFWGINILRKENGIKVKKDFISKIFGKMMPKGPSKLRISKMNMFGMGTKMIESIMKKNNVPSLSDMIKQAMDSGVTMIACNMSMELMGIKKEELIDGVEIGGVASYLGKAEEADMNLFI